MSKYTVSCWRNLRCKGSRPMLSLVQIREGVQRAPNVMWAKVIEAEDEKEALEKAKEMWKNGEESDNLEDIPVTVFKKSKKDKEAA